MAPVIFTATIEIGELPAATGSPIDVKMPLVDQWNRLKYYVIHYLRHKQICRKDGQLLI